MFFLCSFLVYNFPFVFLDQPTTHMFIFLVTATVPLLIVEKNPSTWLISEENKQFEKTYLWALFSSISITPILQLLTRTSRKILTLSLTGSLYYTTATNQWDWRLTRFLKKHGASHHIFARYIAAQHNQRKALSTLFHMVSQMTMIG